MTTIATNRKTMVSDSKVNVETKTEDRQYSATKIFECNGELIGCAGDNKYIELFTKWYGSKKKKPVFPNDIDFEALILRKDGSIVYYDDALACDVIKQDFFAIGSGGNAARAAMIMGANPQEAVAIACQVDPHSAPPFQVLELKE